MPRNSPISVRLGTRGSRLALAQADATAAMLRAHGATVERIIVRTRGDVRTDLTLQGNRDKGLFTSELEQALHEQRVDLAVHSLKDLPTESTPGLVVAAHPERAATGDVLLARPDAVADPGAPWPLAPGARVGTGAARRLALLRVADPDAIGTPIRGNVPTRVQACVDGAVDAVILARAGLARLGLDPSPLVAFDLERDAWIPAPGQGALAIQCREHDDPVRELIASIGVPAVAEAVREERSVLRAFEGGCHAAVGAWWDAGGGMLRAGALVDGGWRATRIPASDPSPAAAAVRALLAGTAIDPIPARWSRRAHPWVAS